MKKAQASFEYMLVFSLGFLVLLPTIYLFYNYSIESSEQIAQNEIAIIGYDLINAAESTAYMGIGSRLTIEETMPDGILNITINQDWDKGTNLIRFNLNDGSSMVYFCNVNINGTFEEVDYTPGFKRIRVEAKNNSNYNYVWIDIY